MSDKKCQYLILRKHSPKGFKDSKFIAAHPDLENDTDFDLNTILSHSSSLDRDTTGYKVWECYYDIDGNGGKGSWFRRNPRIPNVEETKAIIEGSDIWVTHDVDFLAAFYLRPDIDVGHPITLIHKKITYSSECQLVFNDSILYDCLANYRDYTSANKEDIYLSRGRATVVSGEYTVLTMSVYAVSLDDIYERYT